MEICYYSREEGDEEREAEEMLSMHKKRLVKRRRGLQYRIDLLASWSRIVHMSTQDKSP